MVCRGEMLGWETLGTFITTESHCVSLAARNREESKSSAETPSASDLLRDVIHWNTRSQVRSVTEIANHMIDLLFQPK